MFSAVNVLFIKWSGRIADSNATLSKSVALDIATYGRPLANGLLLMVHTQCRYELSYFEIYEL